MLRSIVISYSNIIDVCSFIDLLIASTDQELIWS